MHWSSLQSSPWVANALWFRRCEDVTVFPIMYKNINGILAYVCKYILKDAFYIDPFTFFTYPSLCRTTGRFDIGPLEREGFDWVEIAKAWAV